MRLLHRMFVPAAAPKEARQLRAIWHSRAGALFRSSRRVGRAQDASCLSPTYPRAHGFEPPSGPAEHMMACMHTAAG